MTSDDEAARILRAFADRARADGPRSVVMADLARDLGISTKTLYRVFPSKAALVQGLMDRWASRLEAELQREEAHEDEGPFVDQLLRTSEVWRANRHRFGPAFWTELERDYPSSFAMVAEGRQRVRERMLDRLRPFVRADLSPPLAMELFEAALAHAMDSEVQQRLGVNGRDAVRTAVRVWASGALSEPIRSRRRVRA
jgi:AcrR family transcriptional regulator